MVGYRVCSHSIYQT